MGIFFSVTTKRQLILKTLLLQRAEKKYQFHLHIPVNNNKFVLWCYVTVSFNLKPNYFPCNLWYTKIYNVIFFGGTQLYLVKSENKYICVLQKYSDTKQNAYIHDLS